MEKSSIARYTGGGGVTNLKGDKGFCQKYLSSNFLPNQSFLYQTKINIMLG